MQVIGLCRFSYPAEGGFQVEHATVQDRIAYLYSDARMTERFRHFEALCLPAFRAQTDDDFRLLVLIGDTLPARWRDRLHDLTVGIPQIRIVARAPGNHRKVCADVLNEARRLSQPCLQFRHDDDDAISVDFIARLRAAAADAAPLIDRERYVAIDFARGYIGAPDAQGLSVQETHHPFWGVALAMSVGAGVRQTIMNFNHHRMPEFMPSLSYSDSPMFLRGHNDHNDSRQGKHVKAPTLTRLTPNGETAFRQRFAIDSDQVRRLFS